MPGINHIEVPTETDLAIVGAGLSSCAAAMEVMRQLRHRGLRLTMVDPSGAIGGIAYGPRSGPAAQTITTLNHFSTDSDRSHFLDWIGTGPERLAELQPLPKPFDQVITRWFNQTVNTPAGEIDPNPSWPFQWGQSSAPRRLYGMYLAQCLEAAAFETGTQLNLVAGEVERLGRYQLGPAPFRYSLDVGQDSLHCRGVLLATGQVPNQMLSATSEDNVIQDIYSPSIEATLNKLATTATGLGRGLKVTVAGANASANDLLFHLFYSDLNVDRITIVCPRGQLPSPFDERPTAAIPSPPRLRSLLEESTDPNLDEVTGAIENDISDAQAKGLTIAEFLPGLSAAIGAVLDRLDHDDRQLFAETTGPRLIRLTRRNTPAMGRISRAMIGKGKLALVKGYLVDVEPGKELPLAARFHSEKTVESIEADIVVNCMGAGRVGPASLPLLAKMVADELIRTTPGGRGIAVDDQLRAGEAIVALGPLLAGNVLAGRPVWHLEHAGRLNDLAATAATSLAEAICPARTAP